jgi:phospholipid N-methyltransferase
VSGLPLANFPAALVRSIYDKIFELLEPSGTFVMFEHVMGRELLNTFSAGEARGRIAEILEIEASLEPLVIERKTIPLNVPPARVVVRKHPLAVRSGAA